MPLLVYISSYTEKQPFSQLALKYNNNGQLLRIFLTSPILQKQQRQQQNVHLKMDVNMKQHISKLYKTAQT